MFMYLFYFRAKIGKIVILTKKMTISVTSSSFAREFTVANAEIGALSKCSL